MAQQPNGLLSWLRRVAAKLLPPATPQPEDRESIWSIYRRDARTFFRLVSLLWLVALSYIGYKTLKGPAVQWKAVSSESWWQIAGDFALAALHDFSGVGIGIAILAMLLTRPLNLTGELLMSLYQAMVNRFVTPVIEAHKAEGRAEGLVEGRAEGRVEGRAEGRVEGRAEGRVASNAEWRAWNRRRMDAEAQGRPFDEPPPDNWPDNQEVC